MRRRLRYARPREESSFKKGCGWGCGTTLGAFGAVVAIFVVFFVGPCALVTPVLLPPKEDKDLGERVGWGSAYTNDRVRVRIDSAVIRTGPSGDSLVVTVAVANISPRKILRFEDLGGWSGENPELRDDAGNEILKVPGAMRGGDLDPGVATTRDLLFKVPPPQTQYLLLRLNFRMFGSDGAARFEIPFRRVEDRRDR